MAEVVVLFWAQVLAAEVAVLRGSWRSLMAVCDVVLFVLFCFFFVVNICHKLA